MNNSILDYSSNQINTYRDLLNSVFALSGLFSENDAPMIYYRATENIYSKAFDAQNISRADCSADAVYVNPTDNTRVGVGIKTFIRQNKKTTFQKIAEFDKAESGYHDLSDLELLHKIAELRNQRLRTTKSQYDLDDLIYHCIIRDAMRNIVVFEEPMPFIDIEHIEISQKKDSTYTFSDGHAVYKFMRSKSTLLKQFEIGDELNPMLEFKAVVLEDPLEALMEFMDSWTNPTTKEANLPYIIIPLYTTRAGGRKVVEEKSGLNQWNASGRERNPDELYIPYPKHLREAYPNFFPTNDISWEMTLPNGQVISMKVCQQDGKALMSNPNKALGHWLLRDVLNIPEGKVVTYNDLIVAGIQNVKITKHHDGSYDCDFISDADLQSEDYDFGDEYDL